MLIIAIYRHESTGLQWTPVDCPTMMWVDLAESPYGVQWSPYGIRGGQTRPPSLRGNEAVVKLLLDKGAGLNAEGGYNEGNALITASVHGNEAIVKLLLEEGAGVNVEGGIYGNALQAASYNENVAIVELLLENGAGVNAEGGDFGSALQAA